MFYETRKNDQALRHDPFKAIVAPRPIGWISSVNAKGDINLAPYSYFNGVASVVVRKSASFLPHALQADFRTKPHWIHRFASVLRIRSPLTARPQIEADFGFEGH